MRPIKRIEDLKPGDLIVNEEPITASILGTREQPLLASLTPIVLLGADVCDITSMNEPVWRFTFMADKFPFEREWVDTVFLKNMYLVDTIGSCTGSSLYCGMDAKVF